MADDSTQTYQLRLIFSQYEKCYLTDHLSTYVQKIQRHLPKTILDTDPPYMVSDHRLLQFESTVTTLIPAYDNFLLDVNFWHMFNPSRLLFTAKFSNVNFFTNPYCLLHQLQSEEIPDTLLSLDTPTGTHLIPTHLPIHETKPLLISQLSLNIHLEQLQYSLSPYDIWHQVESTAGHLHFPSTPSVDFSQFPPIQNRQFNPVLPPLPRTVHFTHTTNNNSQQYNPYREIEALRAGIARLSREVHQNHPPPIPQPPHSEQGTQNQNLNNSQTRVPQLSAELQSLTDSLNNIESRSFGTNDTSRGASSRTPRPRLLTAGRGRPSRTLSRPPRPTHLHSPTRAPSLDYDLQPRGRSSPRHGPPPQNPPGLNITPLFQTPEQLKQHWRNTGQHGLDLLEFSDDSQPPGFADSENSLDNPAAKSNPAVNTDPVAKGNPAVNSDPVAKSNPATKGNQPPMTKPVPTPSKDITPVPVPLIVEQPGRLVPPNPSTVQPKQKVLTRATLAAELQNSENLNRLSALIQHAPTKNKFKDYVSPDPLNSDFSVYRLPDYLALYTKDLLLRINMSPSDLPPKLYPYIEFDSKVNRFAPDIKKLTLPTLQKLDHLFNNDKPPTLLTKMADKVAEKVNQKRNKSK